MPPKKAKAAKKAPQTNKNPRVSKRKAVKDEDEPPTKLVRDDSINTQLKKAISVVKKESSKKSCYKIDQFASNYVAVSQANVYEDFSCMLNQTNIGHNNNKFYVIQIIQQTAGKKKTYGAFTRWGRVGESGQHACIITDDIDQAITSFEKKFKDKTKNDWKKRSNFNPAPGKYTMLEIDEESDDEDEVDAGSKTIVSKLNESVKCHLDVRTILLIKLIFNEEMFIGQMTAMHLDVRKMPLGKLSKSQIAKGLEVLIEIEEVIHKKKKGDLSELCSRFYTLVPHDFGRTVPAVINTEAVVNQKKELMMTLSDIELTLSLQKQKTAAKLAIHPLDEKYGKLGCQLELVGKNTKEFKMIQLYAKASTATRKGPILDVWRVDRKGEKERFDLHKKLLNRKLLWHGTNVAVVAAILNSGLRIMPHSGGRVGSGIYFASEHMKSSWYVRIHYGKFEMEANIGFMFLIEVALGNEKHIKIDDSSLRKAPKGYDSVIARGMTEPDEKKNETMKFDGRDVIVPLGKPVKQADFKDSSFGQSEYLVYQESQARIRYLIKFSFL